MDKTIVSSVSINAIEDGQSAPYYFQEWFAWSSVESTVNTTTSPFGNNTEPNPAWSTSIPENTGGLAYLWRKSIRYVWNENTRDYTTETAQYVRMSGTNGTSINVKGNVDYAYQNISSLPPASSSQGKKALIKEDNSLYLCILVYPNYQWVQHPSVSASDGDSYTVGEGNFNGNYQSASNLTGHLVMWSDEADDWVDLGKFQGANGVTRYTHIAWATNVDSTTNPITVTDFIPTKPASDTTHIWMGVYVDTNSGQDSSNAALYTWSNTKGVQGDPGNDAVTYGFVFTEAFAKADANKEITGNIKGYAYKYVGGVRTPLATTKIRFGYILDDDETYADTTTNANGFFDTQGWFNGDLIDDYAKNSPSIFAAIEIGGVIVHVEYITISLQGNTGARGKVGRFFYYGGTFDTNDNTPFPINDAQAPYFDYIKDGQKRYAVYNPANNPAGGSLKMSQMTPLSQGLPDLSTTGTSWKTMTNDFKYIITEAIFGSFAHFGSAIISGDWMMSCFGIIYDTSGGTHVINSKNASWTSGDVTYNYNNAFNLFDADYPNGSKPNALNFVPYYCVDMLAGAVYQQNAFVKGTIEAISGLIGGFIINSTQIKSSDNSNNITLNSDGTAKLGVLSITASGTSITGDLTVSSTSGMYFKLRPSTTSDASISAYNSSGKEMVTLGINSFSRPSLFLGVPSSGQDYKMTARIDPEQISLWGLFGTGGYLSTLDNGLEYLGSISDYYAQTGSNTWKRLQVGIRNSAVMLKAFDENSNSGWPAANLNNQYGGMTSQGYVHSISLANLKLILNAPSSASYYNMLSKCSVLIIRSAD